MSSKFNAAFLKWFGDSAATDEDGNPLLLYHGTPYGGFSEFSTKAQAVGHHGVGIYLTDSAKAAERYGFDRYYEKDYKGDPFRKAIMPVYASIQRCFDQRRFYTADEIDSIVPENARVRKQDWSSSFQEMKSGRKDTSPLNRTLNWIDAEMGGEVEGRELIKYTGILERGVGEKRFQERVSDQEPVWSRDWGLDGIIVLDAISARGGVKHVLRSNDKRKAVNNLTVIVKDSKQIKSAIGNDGTYDADDADIRSNPYDRTEFLPYLDAGMKGLLLRDGDRYRFVAWKVGGMGGPHHDSVFRDYFDDLDLKAAAEFNGKTKTVTISVMDETYEGAVKMASKIIPDIMWENIGSDDDFLLAYGSSRSGGWGRSSKIVRVREMKAKLGLDIRQNPPRRRR